MAIQPYKNISVPVYVIQQSPKELQNKNSLKTILVNVNDEPRLAHIEAQILERNTLIRTYMVIPGAERHTQSYI